MNEKNDFALVPKPSSAVDKPAPGTKRILSGMVKDTLLLAKHELVADAATNLQIDQDACLTTLCRAFRERCQSSNEKPWALELWDLALACLLIVAEGQQTLFLLETTLTELAECREKAASKPWDVQLPWRIALELSGTNPEFASPEHAETVSDREAWLLDYQAPTGNEASSLHQLVTNLDHHNSSTRLGLYDVAWCVRGYLDPVEAATRLLKNVADTLGHVGEAIGLCRALYPTDESFLATANAFQVKQYASQYQRAFGSHYHQEILVSFESQYQNRLTQVREKGTAVFQGHFQRMEMSLRSLISQAAQGLPPDEIKWREF